MMSPLIGRLADLFSIEQALSGLTLLPLLTLVLISHFPAIDGRQSVSDTSASDGNKK